MRRTRIAALACAAGFGAALALSGVTTAMAQPALSTPKPAAVLGHWGKAIPMPGATALTKVTTWVNAVACGQGGTWGHFQGLGVLEQINAGGVAQVDSMSCGSPGDCVGSGYFLDDHGNQEAFFGHEVSGTWENVQTNPTTLSPSNALSQSCVSSGDCEVVGTSQDGSGHAQAFDFSVGDGGEHLATFIPGIAALNVGGNAGATAVSCASVGNCAAGGYYTDMIGDQHAFIAEETGGTWGNAMPVPGIIRLNVLGVANVQNISCPSAGNCAVSGFYTDAHGNEQIFVADEVNGTWGSAIRLPGPASTGNNSGAHVACWSAGNCTAGGAIITSGRLQALVASEKP